MSQRKWNGINEFKLLIRYGKNNKNLIICAVRIWSHIYTYRLSLWLKDKRDMLYTMWIRNFFGNIENTSSILYPCFLEGEGSDKITVGNHSIIQRYCVLGCWKEYNAQNSIQIFNPSIEIGNYCSIGAYSHITAINKITIGDGLLTGRFVYIGDYAHGCLDKDEVDIRPSKRSLISKGEIIIGRNVWLGDKVVVLSGVTIGDNVIVGANSVVTKSLPNNCVAAGIPAKVVKIL